MRIVLDTNVLVSGLLSPGGVASKILALIGPDELGGLSPCYDQRIRVEYEAVLSRPKFPFKSEQVSALLYHLALFGELAEPRRLEMILPDPKDQPFLEVALHVKAGFLITGNIKHFPPKLRLGVNVVTPREFVERLRG